MLKCLKSFWWRTSKKLIRPSMISSRKFVSPAAAPDGMNVNARDSGETKAEAFYKLNSLGKLHLPSCFRGSRECNAKYILLPKSMAPFFINAYFLD